MSPDESTWESADTSCQWELCEKEAVDDHVIEHVHMRFHAVLRLCEEHIERAQYPRDKPLTVTLTLGPLPTLTVHAE